MLVKLSMQYCRNLKRRFWKRIQPNSWFWTSTLRSNSVVKSRRNVSYVSDNSNFFFLQYCILSSTIIHCRSVLLSFELTWWSLHYYNLAVIIKPLGSPVNVMIPGVKPEGLVGPGLSSWFKHTRGFTVNSAGLYLQC